MCSDAGTFCHQRDGDKSCRHCTLSLSLSLSRLDTISTYDSVCVCVCARARSRSYLCMCVLCGGGGLLRMHVRVCAHGCVLTIYQMGTADAEILSTQRFQALSLLRNDVHLEDFMHLIILASQSTVTVRGSGLCCYVSDVCRLLLTLLSLSLSAEFHCRWKGQR